MIVISDTSPIIYFAKTGNISILKDLYSQVFIPNAVWEELTDPLSKPKKEIPIDIKYEVRAKEEGWLIIKDPQQEEYQEIALKLTRDLGRGEAYAIALYLELKADILLINDKMAREIAQSKGISTKWSTEILLDALENNILTSYNEFYNILNKMIELGLWMEKKYYNFILEKAKELKK